MSSRQASITYFAEEGRANFPEVLELVASRAESGDVDTAIMFSATLENAVTAAERLRGVVGLVVVTYRHEAANYSEDDEGNITPEPIGIGPEGKEPLFELGADLIRGKLPFSEIVIPSYSDPKTFAIREALRLISGGCVLVSQAILMACDQGSVSEGDRVISFSGDTAVVATAAHAETAFFPNVGMEIHEIICKPEVLTISRVRRAPRAGDE